MFESKYIGYSDIEIQKVRRIYDWMESTEQDSPQIKEQRYNFGKYFQEHDKRRGTNFKKAFPELGDFYEETLRIKL